MPSPTSSLTSADFTAACESNLVEKTLLFAELPGGQTGGPNPLWFVSGSRLAGYNGVVKARFPKNNLEDAIREAERPFRQRGLSFTWWAGPSSTPANLGAKLQGRGYVHYRDIVAMAAQSDQLTSPYDSLPCLRIEQVTSPEMLYEWHQVYMHGFNCPASIARESLNVMAALSFNPASTWTHYLARQNGRIITISSLFIHNDTAGLYNLVTVPEERGRGIGAAMTLQTFAIARDLGCRIATLQTASPNALRLYHRLGFEVYGNFGIFQYIR